MEAGVALAADHLVRVVLLREQAQGRLDDATAQAQHQVKGGLCNKRKACYKSLLQMSHLEKNYTIIRRSIVYMNKGEGEVPSNDSKLQDISSSFSL